MNKKMNEVLKQLYVLTLKESETVMFWHNGFFYDINTGDEGFEVNVYDGEVDEGLEEVDGGTCTGNERDAIEFMLNEEEQPFDKMKGLSTLEIWDRCIIPEK